MLDALERVTLFRAQAADSHRRVEDIGGDLDSAISLLDLRQSREALALSGAGRNNLPAFSLSATSLRATLLQQQQLCCVLPAADSRLAGGGGVSCVVGAPCLTACGHVEVIDCSCFHVGSGCLPHPDPRS